MAKHCRGFGRVGCIVVELLATGGGYSFGQGVVKEFAYVRVQSAKPLYKQQPNNVFSFFDIWGV